MGEMELQQSIEAFKESFRKKEKEFERNVEEWELKCQKKDTQIEQKIDEVKEKEEEWSSVKKEVEKAHGFHDEIEEQLEKATQHRIDLNNQLNQTHLRLTRMQALFFLIISIIAVIYWNFLMHFDFFFERIFN